MSFDDAWVLLADVVEGAVFLIHVMVEAIDQAKLIDDLGADEERLRDADERPDVGAGSRPLAVGRLL